MAQDWQSDRQERAMAETFLEEQLRRIREMTKQMSNVRALHQNPGARGNAAEAERSSA